MKIRSHTADDDKGVELQMTPMIDIVFQLLVFFIMTFKIVSQEGDFNIKMPLAAPQEGNPEEQDTVPPIKLRLRAGANGGLAGITMNDSITIGLNDGDHWQNLQNRIIGVVGDEGGPSQQEAEVELDCDYNLRYVHVIEAITAVSGYIQDDEIVHLVEKIKFARQRPRAPDDSRE